MTDVKSQVLELPPAVEYFEILGEGSAYRMRSGLVTLESGKDAGEHSTGEYEELIIILEGRGELESEGLGRRPISRGLVAYNPPSTRHNVFNTGDELLRYIYVVSKAQ